MKTLIQLFKEAKIADVGNGRKKKKTNVPMKGKESNGAERVALPKKQGRTIRNHSMSGGLKKTGNATMDKSLPPDAKDTSFKANKLPKHKPHSKIKGGNPFNKKPQKSC